MNTIIESDRLGQERLVLGAETGKLQTYGGLETPFTDDIIQFEFAPKKENAGIGIKQILH